MCEFGLSSVIISENETQLASITVSEFYREWVYK